MNCLPYFFCLPASPAIYTLSLHDALPIFEDVDAAFSRAVAAGARPLEEPTTHVYGERSVVVEDPTGHRWELTQTERSDRKSTRLNSSHRCISYAVFCLKKKIRTAVHLAFG